MAPTLVASYFVTSNPNSNTNTLTTPSFTPSNGEVIIVKAATWDSTITMGTPTGGSQTYTLRVSATSGGFNVWVGIWSATVSGSPGSMTISSTPSASSWHNLLVERWSGAQLAATPVTSTGNSLGAPASASLTTTAANSVISWVAGDAQSIDPATRAYLSSATEENCDDGHSGSNGVWYYAYQTAASAGSQSYGLSAPTGMTYWIAGIEILASGGAAPVYPPNLEQRRRLLAAPRQVRGGGRIATPVRSQINPPFPFTGVKQPRELRGKLARRGECWMPVPAQVILAAPAYPPQPERERIKVLRQFRGRMSAPPLDQTLAPAVVPARRKGFKQRARLETVTPVPAQVVLAAPAYPPQSVRTRLRGLRIFRGRAAAPVPAQASVVPPAYVPQVVRPRLKWLRLFRARAAAPPIDQTLAPPAPRARVHGMVPRRGHIAVPVPPQATVAPPAYPVRPVRQRLKGLRQSRGREAATPTPPQIVIPPPPYIPVFARVKKRLGLLFRGQTVTPVTETCDCTTHRPNLGTTTRPGSGLTSRPNSGTTDRPCSCSGG